MRTTVTLDDDLLERAKELTGIEEGPALLREALKALIAREAEAASYASWRIRSEGNGGCVDDPVRRSRRSPPWFWPTRLIWRDVAFAARTSTCTI